MQRKNGSKELAFRLSTDTANVRTGSQFQETIREALRNVRGGSKRHRVLYGEENCATAVEGLAIELLANGTPIDGVRRVRDAFTRAFNDLIGRAQPLTLPDVKYLIGHETAINGVQNVDAVEVLTDGSLSDCERLLESTRQQREVSDLLILSLSERIAQMRRTA
jgi:hypothetical protein